MPDALLRSCTRDGCPNLSKGGPCDKCRAERQQLEDQRRGTAAERGYGPKWAALSKRLRLGALRWCGSRLDGLPATGDSTCPQTLAGRVGSQVVDHVQPVTGPKDPRFWLRSNWQGLCHPCHDRKRQRESRAPRPSRLPPGLGGR